MLWKRNPGFATFITFLCLLIPLMIVGLPWVGPLVASILGPVFLLTIVNGFRFIDRHREGMPDPLFSGLRSSLPALITLGAIYLVANLVMEKLVMLATGINPEALLASRIAGSEITPETINQLFYPVMMMTLVKLPLLLAYWLAPVLVGWWSVRPLKAMFFSFVATLRNWRPFLACNITVAAASAAIWILLLAVSLMVPTLAGLLALLLFGIFPPILFATYYVIARDIFVVTDSVAVGEEDV